VLLCQKLPHTGTQHGATIRAAAVWRPTATFELHLPASTLDNRLKHGNGTTVAIAVAGLERTLLGVLGAEDGKSVATGPTHLAHRLRNLRQVAAEHAHEIVGLCQAVGKTQFMEKVLAVRDVFGVVNGCGFDGNIVPREDLSRRVGSTVCFCLRIAFERLHKGVACQFGKIFQRRNGRGSVLGQSIFHGIERSRSWGVVMQRH